MNFWCAPAMNVHVSGITPSGNPFPLKSILYSSLDLRFLGALTLNCFQSLGLICTHSCVQM